MRTARVIGESKRGFDDKFRRPRGEYDQAMLDLARGIAAIVADAAVKVEFISHAMPTDFVEDLDDDIAAMQEAISDQSEGRADIKSAGVSIDETDARCMQPARAMDIVVKNFFRNNAAVLAEWETGWYERPGSGLRSVRFSLVGMDNFCPVENRTNRKPDMLIGAAIPLSALSISLHSRRTPTARRW